MVCFDCPSTLPLNFLKAPSSFVPRIFSRTRIVEFASLKFSGSFSVIGSFSEILFQPSPILACSVFFLFAFRTLICHPLLFLFSVQIGCLKFDYYRVLLQISRSFLIFHSLFSSSFPRFHCTYNLTTGTLHPFKPSTKVGLYAFRDSIAAIYFMRNSLTFPPFGSVRTQDLTIPI